MPIDRSRLMHVNLRQAPVFRVPDRAQKTGERFAPEFDLEFTPNGLMITFNTPFW
jgi:hypothetical protein